MFQSHLYGIESRVGRSCPAWYSCFNRTFMELKGAAICCVDELKMFQSHLYGIERN